MPKIIENLPHKLMAEARRQVLEAGYSALTVRSVAKECGVGVGTVYNYFDSKDALAAAFMLEDWNCCIRRIEECASTASQAAPILRSIYDELQGFYRLYEAVFHDQSAVAGFSGSFSKYHRMLRSQLSAPVRKFCRDDFTAEFIAEAMLVWTVSGTDFPQLQSIINHLL